MSENEVRAQKTPLTAVVVYASLAQAWTEQVTELPSRASLLLLMSQMWLETGNGQQCFNFNMGGIKHVAGDGHDYYRTLTHEGSGDKQVTITASFRAYGSLDEGVRDYLRTVRTTFGFAWPAVEAGDVADFAHRLRARNYFTADENLYRAGMQARLNLLATLLPEGSPDDTLPDSPSANRIETVMQAIPMHDDKPPDEEG